MRRLLVVSYYTPPLGLSGVMRVTKLCKFLPDFGWRPLILTVKPAAYYYYDPALSADLERSRIFRTESFDPARLLNRLRFRGRRLKPALSRSLGRGPRLLNYLLFPDSKAGWLPFGSVAGRHLIDRERPAAILATGPPFTALLLGVRLKAHAHVPLVLDFRDPWPAGFVPPPPHQRPLVRRLRRYLVDHADLALAVNDGTARAVGEGVTVLDNGFDPTDFEAPAQSLEGFSVVHVGNVWQTEAEMLSAADEVEAVPDAHLHVVGRVSGELRRRLGDRPRIHLSGPLAHAHACRVMKGADVLLYVGKPGQPVGLKLYEYLGARRPVVVWGEGADEATRLVEEAGAGLACRKPGALTQALVRLRSDPGRYAGGSRQRFDRRWQAQWLAGRIESLL